MKIIITGCNGQLGSSFVKISKNYKHKFYFFDKKKLNITNKSILEKIVKKIKPDYFINCSAYTNVNNAEIELFNSWNVNSSSLKLISYICKKYKTTLIHFSTDYVFDGKKKSPYLEIDKTAPLSAYGRSKLGGENEILISGVNYIIVRISWLYNPLFKYNIIHKLIENIKNKKQFSAVINETSKPTCSLNLANNILSMISFKDKLKNSNLIFHYSDMGNPVSIYELSKFIKKNVKFRLYSTKILPINSGQFSSKVVRPAYSVLSNKNFSEKFDLNTYNWRKLLNNNIRDFFNMKGIILAGGMGTRLHPLTISVSKQLLPLFDKPMIYYPLATLIELGISEILLICKKEDKKLFEKILKTGSQWGVKISYEIQEKPSGIAESFIIGKKFIKKDSVALILGDNIFYGIDFDISKFKSGANIFAYQVNDPQRYGVVELKNKIPHKIVEKPKNPKSNYAVTGLYLFDNKVINISENIKPSKRGELEITDINNEYLRRKKLEVSILKKGSMWLDAGTFSSLLQASLFIQTLQERQNIQIGSPESASFHKKFINKKQLKIILKNSSNNEYYENLKKLI